jgi:hypothetical protein
MSQTNKESYVGPAVLSVIVVPAMIVLLRVQGRLWTSAGGELKFWIGDTCSSNNSQQLFDPYSFTHVLHGFLFFWIVLLLFKRIGPSWQILVPLILEAAWEVFENTPFIINRYRTETAALGYSGDTIVNSCGDLTCAFVGFLVARWLGWWRSLIVFLVLEVILILWIRDSLLLEILMLIRPISALKSWQLCQ